jgi:hypothetical protein
MFWAVSAEAEGQAEPQTLYTRRRGPATPEGRPIHNAHMAEAYFPNGSGSSNPPSFR